MAEAGSADSDAVRVTGPDEWFASRHAVTPMLTASVVAVAEAAHALARARGFAPDEPFEIDTRSVVLACSSEGRARCNGEPLPLWAPLSGFFRTSDGWVRLHANYSHHQMRLMALLGFDAEPSREDVATEILHWESLALEDALTAAGGCGVAVRDRATWQQHPQAVVVAATPLVINTPAPTQAAPELPPMRSGDLPLAGIRVLDLTRVIAGPVATRTLAALGADILRIDAPDMPELANWVDSVVGKRSVTLDLHLPANRTTLAALLADADVLVTGYRPGALEPFGLDPANLANTHPHLVVVTLSAWGREGAWADRRGFDSLVQAVTGIGWSEVGGRGAASAPGALPLQALDHATGYLAAAAALDGLLHRAQWRAGSWHDLALARTAHWLQHGDWPPTTPTTMPLDSSDRMVTLESDLGRLDLVESPLRLRGRALPWPRPTPEQGADSPVWLPLPV